MTYRLPSLNALRAFEAAARSQSFKAAAMELGVSPGAVSQQVRKLEHSLGIDLFDRLPHGLRLTETGARYLPKVTKVFDDLTEATEEIAPNLNARKFTVGLSANAAAFLPKGWPLGVMDLKPYVRDRIVSSDPGPLERGEVDCLIQLSATTGADMHVLKIDPGKLAPDPLYLICKTSLAHCRQISELATSLERVLRSADQSV